jgi:predicted  nucleic acid-binding Zn-ribbon protein
MTTAGEQPDGLARLAAQVAHTRRCAARAMTELHALMSAELDEAERRARRAERQLARTRRRLREQRGRADRQRSRTETAEAELAALLQDPAVRLVLAVRDRVSRRR